MTIRFALALIVTLLAAFPALASPSCMTKHEARAHYGNDWIYWHTERHCWDNHRGRQVKIASEAHVPVPKPRPLPYAPTEFELRFLGQ